MSEYSQALNEVAKYLSSPVGFSDHDSPKEDSKIIIRQEIAEEIDMESFMTKTEISNNKNKSIIEYMEKANLDDEIIYWENKLKHIEWEYSHSMTTDWPKIREKELFIIREVARLERIKNEKKVATSSSHIIYNKLLLEKNVEEEGKVDLKIEMMNQVDCEHDWIKGKGDYNIKCAFCIYYPSQDNRFTCSLCLRQACASCLRARNQKWRQEIEVEPEDRILSSRVRNLENRINKLEAELEKLKDQLEDNKEQENDVAGNTEMKE